MLEQIVGDEEEKNEAMEIKTIKEETEFTSKVGDNLEGQGYEDEDFNFDSNRMLNNDNKRRRKTEQVRSSKEAGEVNYRRQYDSIL